jgi:hypothetical protein
MAARMNDKPESPKFTIRNVQVSTAKVEIQRLSLGGKEITIAVFRQFIEEPLIAEDGSLNGVPWGVVNYHPDKCSNAGPHWHVVWQKGEELRRSQVSVTYEPDPVFVSPALARLHAASVYDQLTTGNPPGQGAIFGLFGEMGRWMWTYYGRRPDLTDEETGIKVSYQPPEGIKAALQANSDLARVLQLREVTKKSVALAEQNLQEASQEVAAAVSRHGFRRARVPENHRQECTCMECLRADPRKAADHVRKAEKRLERARDEFRDYSPDSPEGQRARAALSTALSALRSYYAGKSFNSLRAAYRRELKDEIERRKNQAKVRKEVIADLPQLFIEA